LIMIHLYNHRLMTIHLLYKHINVGGRQPPLVYNRVKRWQNLSLHARDNIANFYLSWLVYMCVLNRGAFVAVFTKLTERITAKRPAHLQPFYLDFLTPNFAQNNSSLILRDDSWQLGIMENNYLPSGQEASTGLQLTKYFLTKKPQNVCDKCY